MADIESIDIKELLARAQDGFGRAVAAVPAGRWGASTPCSDWDLRTLVNHIVGEDVWVPPLLAGATIAEVGDRFDGDLLGDDPYAAWQEASQQAKAAWADTPLERTVHLSFGDHPASDYAWQLFTDHLIHTWDVAAAVGAGTTLDPELVAVCARWFDSYEAMYRQMGVIADPVPLPAGAGSQQRLLARFGRDPSFRPG